MIDDDLDRALRKKQSQNIQENQSSYSYSKTLNDAVRKGLKK